MRTDSGLVIDGIDGGAMLGFLSAVGLQLVLTARANDPGKAPRLSWRQLDAWRPVLHGPVTLDDVVPAVESDARDWENAPILKFCYAKVEKTGVKPGDPRAVANEMAFDFFFARDAHPLLPLRSSEVLSALAGLLGSDKRAAVRAAIHGLGHLVANGRRSDDRVGADAQRLLEEYVDGRLGGVLDASLREYAGEARSGALP